MRGSWLLFLKEMRQAVRDRRTVFITVVFPLAFYPLLFGLMGNLVRQEGARLADFTPHVLVVGDADGLVQALKGSTDLSVRSAPDLAAGQEAVRQGTAHALVEVRRVPERGELGYMVTLHVDGSRPETPVAVAKLKAFLQAYFQGVVISRLGDLGVDPQTLEPPFTVEIADIAGEDALAHVLLIRMLPYFLVLSILSGAMGFGAEITAGEKERGTLATLLVSRLTRGEIVLGKFMAILAVSLTTTLLSAIGLILGIQSFGAGPGGIPAQAAAWTVALLLPLAMALSALVLIVGSFARNQKEANAYLLPLMMLVVLIGVSTMIGTTDPRGAELAIPIAGPMAALGRALAGTLTGADVGWAFLSSAALAVLLIALAVRLFRSESVLFRV
ncbi:MAG: ABC transporter permease [Candidatus Bipolaricaulota bacterium]